MNLFFRLLVILGFVFLSSCEDVKKRKELDLIPSNEIVKFKLDSQTSLNSFTRINFSKQNDTTYISFFNSHEKKIICYNTFNLKVKEFKYKKEGPNALGYGTVLVFDDSLDFKKTIFYESSKNRFVFFNNDTIVKKVSFDSLNRKLGMYSSDWFCPSIENITNDKGTLFFSGLTDYHQARKDKKELYNFFKYDLDQDTLKYFIPIPEEFKESNWGRYTLILTTPTYIFNEDKSLCLVAFKGLSYGHLIDMNTGSVNRIDLKSDYITWKTPNIKDDEDRKEALRFCVTNGSYDWLFYDKYRKYYMRLVILPVTESDYSKGKYQDSFSILIFDKEFKPLGEVLFEGGYEKYDPTKLYIKEDGLYIIRRDLYSENDDYMYFEKIKYKKIK